MRCGMLYQVLGYQTGRGRDWRGKRGHAGEICDRRRQTSDLVSKECKEERRREKDIIQIDYVRLG